MKRCCRAVVVGLSLGLFLVPVDVRADDSLDPLADFADPAAPRKLLAEGRALMRRGRYDEACPKLEASIRLDASLGAQFDLADCNDHLGKITSAWAGYVEVARSTAADQGEQKRRARQRVRALEKTLPKLLIDVPTIGPGVEIRRDGIVIPQAEWGASIPVDPGQHRVTVSVPGRARWLTIVDASLGETARVEIPREVVPTPQDFEVSAAASAGEGVQYALTQRSGDYVFAGAH